VGVRLVTVVGVSAAVIGGLAVAQGVRSSPPAASPAPMRAGLAKATFAGGCFWCMEPPFEKLPGVISVTSGYIGGPEKNPTYEQVSNHRTGHAEAVEIVFDPKVVGYERLLEVFWHNVDPTTDDRQFCDTGRQYRTGIFVHDAGQRRLAEGSKRAIERTKTFAGPVLTPIEDAGTFWVAEEYHQDFYKKNPVRYYSYRAGCGRDRRLADLWGDKAGK
jgi:peptide-methionine (S)-S-oxide reductase